MQLISRDELEAQADTIDALVERDPSVDPFCTRSAWQLAYHDAFAPHRRLWLGRSADSAVLLAEYSRPGIGVILEPLESMWGFASPVIGPEGPELLARSLLDHPRTVLLTGFPMLQARWTALTDILAGHYGSGPIEQTARRVASLEGGIDGWLARRSRRFRERLRADLRRVEASGVKFRRIGSIEPTEVSTLYQQVLEVESRSWKSEAGNGADSGPMRAFYERMWPRLVELGQLRVIFAERDGERLGYLHGGLVGRHFRGLQFSFDDKERALGLGNALQYAMLDWLCETGAARYDLGGYSAYKQRWAEPGLATLGVLLRPRQ